MEHTLNKLLFIILPNLTCFFFWKKNPHFILVHLVKYHDFVWGRLIVNMLTNGELVSWDQVRTIIGNNAYYGFKRNMGPAKSTNYKSVVRELLVNINGLH